LKIEIILKIINQVNIIFSIKKMTSMQRGVWRQAGRCLVGHFAGIWKFASRPSLCETPPARQAPDTLSASRATVHLEKVAV